MVSLLHLADINEEGVTFQSPTDGKRMLLTPEHSIQVSSTQAWHAVAPAAANESQQHGLMTTWLWVVCANM
jgi:hypothetical protein